MTANESIVDSTRCFDNGSYDNRFGPAVQNCHADFDFTYLFEQSILSLIPSTLLLLYLPYRLRQLCSEGSKARLHGITLIKQVRNKSSNDDRLFTLHQALYVLILAAQLVTLVFYVSPVIPFIRTTIASQVLAVAVILGLSSLSLLEHGRSLRSSDGINVYLFFSITFDAVQVRTLWLRLDSLKLAAAATVCLALKLVILGFEAQGKRKYLFRKYQSLAPETLSGVFARRCFWWLNGMLMRGYKNLIRPDQLEDIKEDFASRDLLQSLEGSYNRGKLLLQILFSVLPAKRYSEVSPAHKELSCRPLVLSSGSRCTASCTDGIPLFATISLRVYHLFRADTGV
jgi:ATP-binding cassette subfamily C (CFTR/MRP) protein 1